MILDQKVTYFRTTTDVEVGGTWTIREILEAIKDENYIDDIKKVRKGDDYIKRNLPTVAMHGLFEFNRKKKDFYEASGLIILDIDDVELDEIQEIKEDIVESSDNVLAAMTSPSGNGIKVLYYVTPELVTAENYRQIGKQVVSEFDIYGDVDFLSVTDCLIMTSDPDIIVNEDVEPAFVYVREIDKKSGVLEELDTSRTLWEDPEDFYYKVLVRNIEEKTNNNFHFIQVSILDLAKFGFKHPEHDLSFVIDEAEQLFKSSSKNRDRLREVAAIAAEYPQTQWPYRAEYDDEEEESEIDYSEYMSDEDESEEEIERDEYLEELYLKVVGVAKEGNRVGYEVALEGLANAIRFKSLGVFTITGIPGHGKTEAADVITLDLARLYGHETIVAGFEQTIEEHIIKLIRKILNKDITCKTWFIEKNMPTFREAYDFITSKYYHIDITKVGGDINNILEEAAKRIKESRDDGGNPKYMVIDPFNMLSIKGRLGGTEKIEEILRRITHFSHQMGVLVFLIAHPKKMTVDEKTGEYKVPDFYDVKGSSAFFEMSYHGMVVYRLNNGLVMLKILKVKQSNLGVKDAECFFSYDRLSGRYLPVDEDGNEVSGDHRDDDWLEKSNNILNNNKDE